MARNIITGIDVGTYYVKVVIADPKVRNEKNMPKMLAAGMALGTAVLGAWAPAAWSVMGLGLALYGI